MAIKQFLYVDSDGFYTEGHVEGNIVVRNCDTELAVGDFVCESSSITDGVDKVKDNANYPSVIGFCVGKPTADTAEILTKGVVEGLVSLTKGSKVYLAENGTATSTQPTNNYLQILGHAIESDKMDFDPTPTRVKRRIVVTTPADKTYILVQAGAEGSELTNSSTIAGTDLSAIAGMTLPTSVSDQARFGNTSLYGSDTQGAITAEDAMWKLPGDATIDAWIYPTTSDADGSIISSVESGSADSERGLGLIIRSGNIMYWAGASNSGYYHTESIAYDLNRWQHIAIEKIGTDFYCYLDGELKVSFSFTSSLGSQKFTVMGAVYRDSTSDALDNVYIDQGRLVIGQAMYGAQSFTPPAGPYQLV